MGSEQDLRMKVELLGVEFHKRILTVLDETRPKGSAVIYQYVGQDVKQCKCGAWIYFVGNMPVNVQTHQTHFADCPNADEFRKRK